MNRFLPLILFALVVAAAVWGLLIREDRDALPSALLSKPAPAFDLPVFEADSRFTLADMQGEGPSVLNFWASWCGPCRVEHKELVALDGMGIPVYGVNYKDKPEKARQFLDSLGNPFTAIGVDDSGRTAIDYGVAALPETFVIDAEGNIVYKHVGPINPGELEGKVLPAIEAARKK